jgi:hypothetical protein
MIVPPGAPERQAASLAETEQGHRTLSFLGSGMGALSGRLHLGLEREHGQRLRPYPRGR